MKYLALVPVTLALMCFWAIVLAIAAFEIVCRPRINPFTQMPWGVPWGSDLDQS